LNTWLNGIKSELEFWNNVIETKGSEWNINWTDLISDERKFKLEKYIDRDEITFIDVGSGPFSSTGKYAQKTNLVFYAVDPLAYIYKTLKLKNKIITGITPEYCMVERLVEKYGTNKFDIVHMRNSLDHSFNPVVGIIQMLGICKLGGKIILQHAKNEAEREDYQGFHQWNLCVENNEFFIWRKEIRYNISKMFKKATDINIEKTNEDWVGVIITKKAGVEVDYELQTKIINILDEKVFEKLSNVIVNNFFNQKLINISRKTKIIFKKIPIIGNILRKIWLFRLNGGRVHV
jgi:SAM-dependent methyltransferase